MKLMFLKRGSFLFLLLLMAYTGHSTEETRNFNKKWTEAAEDFVRKSLPGTTIPFPASYDPRVEKWVKMYMTRGSRSFERMLGKTTYYFPIFENALTEHNLPEELKYLAMVESSLKPAIESPVGAGGLWQFMPATARHYKLEMNEWKDDRFNPYHSSEAAAQMLSELYQQFEDWQLVLAAYNCGPGRVRKAIKKAGHSDYRNIQSFLPKQTRDYLLKYTATAFVSEHYSSLGLVPSKFDLEREKTSVLKVYEWLSFSSISDATGTNIEKLKRLNPSYKLGIIPKNDAGNLLVIPSSSALSFEEYYQKRGLESIAYVYGKPKRLQPEPKTTEYWASAYVRPVASSSIFQINLQGLLSWSHSWGKSLFSTIKLRNFFSSQLKFWV